MKEEGQGVSVVVTTTSGEGEARAIAKELVEKGLVACCSYFPVRSVYSWQGEVHDDPEYMVIMKTRKGLVQEVMGQVKELHSYEVPEIMEVETGAVYQPYVQWLYEVTKDAKSS